MFKNSLENKEYSLDLGDIFDPAIDRTLAAHVKRIDAIIESEILDKDRRKGIDTSIEYYKYHVEDYDTFQEFKTKEMTRYNRDHDNIPNIIYIKEFNDLWNMKTYNIFRYQSVNEFLEKESKAFKKKNKTLSDDDVTRAMNHLWNISRHISGSVTRGHRYGGNRYRVDSYQFYQLFMNRELDNYKRDHPPLSHRDAFRQLADIWKTRSGPLHQATVPESESEKEEEESESEEEEEESESEEDVI